MPSSLHSLKSYLLRRHLFCKSRLSTPIPPYSFGWHKMGQLINLYFFLWSSFCQKNLPQLKRKKGRQLFRATNASCNLDALTCDPAWLPSPSAAEGNQKPRKETGEASVSICALPLAIPCPPPDPASSIFLTSRSCVSCSCLLVLAPPMHRLLELLHRPNVQPTPRSSLNLAAVVVDQQEDSY
jgi:hypothetical protein